MRPKRRARAKFAGTERCTSAVVEREVISRRIAGRITPSDCSEVGIDRGTVGRILSRTQIEEAIADARSRLVSMAGDAIARVHRAIKSKHDDGLEASLAVLKGVGALQEVRFTDGRDAMSDDELLAIIEGRATAPSVGTQDSGTTATDTKVQ